MLESHDRLIGGAAPRAYFELTDSGVSLLIRATPGAAKDEIAGVWIGPNGESRLSVKVTAPPDKGKANAAIVRCLAKNLGAPKSAIVVIAGEKSRLKTVAIRGDPKALNARLRKFAGSHAPPAEV